MSAVAGAVESMLSGLLAALGSPEPAAGPCGEGTVAFTTIFESCSDASLMDEGDQPQAEDNSHEGEAHANPNEPVQPLASLAPGTHLSPAALLASLSAAGHLQSFSPASSPRPESHTNAVDSGLRPRHAALSTLPVPEGLSVSWTRQPLSSPHARLDAATPFQAFSAAIQRRPVPSELISLPSPEAHGLASATPSDGTLPQQLTTQSGDPYRLSGVGAPLSPDSGELEDQPEQSASEPEATLPSDASPSHGRPAMTTAHVPGEVPRVAERSTGPSEAHSVAGTPALPPDLPVEETRSSQPLTRVTVEVVSDTDRVSIHLAERQGRMEVAVRSADPDLASGLRAEVGRLASALDASGYSMNAPRRDAVEGNPSVSELAARDPDSAPSLPVAEPSSSPNEHRDGGQRRRVWWQWEDEQRQPARGRHTKESR